MLLRISIPDYLYAKEYNGQEGAITVLGNDYWLLVHREGGKEWRMLGNFIIACYCVA